MTDERFTYETNHQFQDEQLRTYCPEVVILPDTTQVDRFAAEKLVEQIQQKQDSVLTLPTGNTPKGMFNIKLVVK